MPRDPLAYFVIAERHATVEGDPPERGTQSVLTTRRMLDEYLLYVGDPPAVDGRASLT
ncbi:hypothetical protein [Cellulomonas humilata]|uniref:Uncharacterized protein n=1 Tax=Cellulomonas humilata TaxID=144055 RepID=A0ABU0EH81_9CELL|nr:hypothetical protein [Cellulomonas humilata]MDQ0374630.1 hypothetical protein [Cellulomonas humilata]